MSFTNFDNIEECDLLTLSQLKSLYNMNYLDREDELLRLGFSFGGEIETVDGTFSREYSKCLGSNKAEYINSDTSSFQYTTNSKETYLKVKNQLKQLKSCKRMQEGKYDVFFDSSDDGYMFMFYLHFIEGESVYMIYITDL
jgi:predicted Zn-dependent protease